MQTVTELASEIAKVEGKKSKVNIGDIREVLKIIADMAPLGSLDILAAYSKRVMARKKTKKKTKKN